MNVHLFGKIDSPCIANWALQKTVKDNEDQLVTVLPNAILKNVHMNNYLDSFPTTQKAMIDTCIEVIKTLSAGGFTLTKFISNSKKNRKSYYCMTFLKNILLLTQIYRTPQYKERWEFYRTQKMTS